MYRFCAAIACLLAATHGQDNDDLHYVCSQVDQMKDFCENRAGDIMVEKGIKVLRGRTGKAGPVGPPGPSANVDYSKVDETIEAKFKVLERSFDSKLSLLQSFQPPPRQPADEYAIDIGTEARPSGYLCDLIYRDVCYRIIGRLSRSVRFNHFDAESECRSFGGKLAHIVNKEHYDMIYNYVRKLYSRTVWMWLGMYYKSGRVILSDSSPAPYIRWHGGFPKSGDRPKMGMRVEDGPAKHMFNDPSSYTLGNALCQFRLRNE